MHFAADFQLGHHVAQGGSQAFFDNGMIERHIQHLRNGHTRLMRPSQQVCQMFGGRAEDFRADEATAALFGIHAHMAFVYQHHAAAPLIAEGNFADGDAFGIFVALAHLGVTQADAGNLRIGKHHADGAAAQAVCDIRIASGIVARDFALVAGFVQQRQLVGCVAGDEDVRDAGLHGQRMGFRHAAFVQFDIQVFQTDVVGIRTAADGGQQVLRGECAALSVFAPFDFHIAFAVQADFGVGVQVQGQFFAEHGFGFFQHHGVGNAANQAAFTEDFNFYA